MDQQFAASPRDWNAEVLALYQGIEKQQETEWKKTVSERLADTRTGLPMDQYPGTYRNAAVGDIKVEQMGDGLILHSGRLQFELEHWHLDTFLAANKARDWKFLLPFRISGEARVRSIEVFGHTFDKLAAQAE
jgi:hypothetical protein